jgi:hypothetical protein
MRGYSRDDVQTHSDGFRDSLPAVNVKVYDSLADGYKKFRADDPDADAGFTLDWIEENVSEEALDALFWHTCEWETEYVEGFVAEILGPHATLERQGRSGGWLAIRGLDDLDEWDAVQLAKWRKFEKWTRDVADGIMASLVQTIYINDYEWSQDETAEAARAADHNIATAGA